MGTACGTGASCVCDCERVRSSLSREALLDRFSARTTAARHRAERRSASVPAPTPLRVAAA